jgi:hypothetical protein
MAKKKLDLKAAKAAKQKKILIVGGILFVALLAFQVPRTMKMLHPKHSASPQAVRAYSASAPTPATTPAAAGAPTTSVSSATANTTVLTAQLAPAAQEGQLAELSASFQSKDPFKQLIDEDAAAPSGTTNPTETATSAKPDVTLKVVPSTTTGPAAPSTAAPDGHQIALPFVSAVISVNGVKGGVNVKVDFPADAPLFHLVSLTKKTAKISVSGGSLANGSQTLTLRRGKPLTLVNTADGTRYRLVLVTTSRSAATAVAAPTTGAEATSPTTTPTTPTTTTQTTTTPTIGG